MAASHWVTLLVNQVMSSHARKKVLTEAKALASNRRSSCSSAVKLCVMTTNSLHAIIGSQWWNQAPLRAPYPGFPAISCTLVPPPFQFRPASPGQDECICFNFRHRTSGKGVYWRTGTVLQQRFVQVLQRVAVEHQER